MHTMKFPSFNFEQIYIFRNVKAFFVPSYKSEPCDKWILVQQQNININFDWISESIHEMSKWISIWYLPFTILENVWKTHWGFCFIATFWTKFNGNIYFWCFFMIFQLFYKTWNFLICKLTCKKFKIKLQRSINTE